jgi:hypothetical protein
MNDTSPEIAALVRERLLARSGAERVVMGSRMFDVARAMVLASFPSGLSELEIKGRLCDRLYGKEVDVPAFVEHLRLSEIVALKETEPCIENFRLSGAEK